MATTAENTSRLASPAEERLAEYRRHVAFNKALKEAYEAAADEAPSNHSHSFTADVHAQFQVAAAMNMTAEEVAAEVELLDKSPYVLQLTPRLVIDEYLLGHRSREDMIERLKAWPYTYPAHVYADEAAGGDLIGITPSTWSQVKAAYLAGDIDPDAFAEIEASSGRPATAV